MASTSAIVRRSFSSYVTNAAGTTANATTATVPHHAVNTPPNTHTNTPNTNTNTNTNRNNTNHGKRPIYVAATRQHVGKTSVSLALMSGLQKRFPSRVGFIKPVGQQSHVVYEEDLERDVLVDKDVAVTRQHFQLTHLPYRYMSPVLIPPGYTRDYLDGHITNASQHAKVQESYDQIQARSDVVLCEGTGHCAVGSIVGAGNAQVASWIGADMVLVANGGLGSTFDELELNRIYCAYHKVNVVGVIINRVQPSKYDQTHTYLEKALRHHWNIPLLGCIPDRPFLGCPALQDMERMFGTQLVSGHKHRLRHYTVHELMLVGTSSGVFLENLRQKPTRTLYVCHASRSDVLLGFITEYQRRMANQEPDFEAAMIVCGHPSQYPIDTYIVDMLQGLDVPILQSPHTTAETMELIHGLTPKLNAADSHRVDATVEHYESYIDFDQLLDITGNTMTTATTTTTTTTAGQSSSSSPQESNAVVLPNAAAS
mmetsp:Transcript_7884/g.12057  ORF Transcript_7884/g.12057 Transcript_7884/m.12057 type:complete len:484 (+) Transcript_7884:161-1612(+)